jgi:hypothetical protein
MKTTRERWGGRYDFLLIAHEHLFVFRKPGEEDDALQGAHEVVPSLISNDLLELGDQGRQVLGDGLP